MRTTAMLAGDRVTVMRHARRYGVCMGFAGAYRAGNGRNHDRCREGLAEQHDKDEQEREPRRTSSSVDALYPHMITYSCGQW